MQNFKIELKWALLFIGMTWVWMIIERAVGLHDTYISQHPTYTNLVAIPAILLYVLAMREKRSQFYKGTMTYKQGVIFGLIMTGIITALVPLSQLVISNVISPDYFKNAIEYSVSSGQATQEEADSFFNIKSYIIQGMIGAPIMAILTTLIVAIFVKKS